MTHLRIAGTEGAKPARRKWQRGPDALTPEQQAKARAALKNLRSAYGGWGPLAEVMGVSRASLKEGARGNSTITGDTLIRLCRAGGLSVDAMLEAKLTSSGRCAACGAMRRAS